MSFSFFKRRRRRPKFDVSVVIPVYNHGRYLRATIESVLDQTVGVREILCIDDGSRDDSFDVARAVAASNPSVRTWTRPNRGANKTINEGIAAAEGAFVAILNSDDLFERTRIERCVGLLESDPTASVACTGVAFIDGVGRSIPNRWYDDALAFHRRSGDLAASLVNANFVMTTSNIVARRSLFTEVGDFRDLRYAHDLDFLLRLVALDRRVAFVESPLLEYRFHDSNTISESHAAVKTEVAAVVAAYVRRRFRRPFDSNSVPEIQRLFEVTDAHALTAGVVTFLARRANDGSDDLDPSTFLVDPEIERIRRGLVP